MYAIIDISGHQYKIEKEQVLNVNQLQGNEGETIEIEKVLLTDNNGKVKIGSPTVKGSKVTAKILEHLKGDKVIVFKKKKKKGYRIKKGHRQSLTKIQIEEIK
jgi:large subunit ribosomal protein L21